MWPASWPSTVRISSPSEHVDGARDDHDHRPLGADRGRVGDRELRQVELRDLGDVQPRERRAVRRPDFGQLVGAELHRAAEEHLAQRALVAELDQLAHHLIEHRDALQRGGRGAVGRVLVRLGGDLDEALIVGKRVAHGAKVATLTNQRAGARSRRRITSRRPLQVSSIAQTLLSTSRFASASSRTTSSVRSVGDARGALGPRDPQPARPAPSARAAPASGAASSRARGRGRTRSRRRSRAPWCAARRPRAARPACRPRSRRARRGRARDGPA